MWSFKILTNEKVAIIVEWILKYARIQIINKPNKTEEEGCRL